MDARRRRHRRGRIDVAAARVWKSVGWRGAGDAGHVLCLSHCATVEFHRPGSVGTGAAASVRLACIAATRPGCGVFYGRFAIWHRRGRSGMGWCLRPDRACSPAGAPSLREGPGREPARECDKGRGVRRFDGRGHDPST